MPLVVARSTVSSILLIADTKISEPEKRINPYLQGLSKVVFVDSARLVAFAGDVEAAYSRIRKINKELSNSEIVDCLSTEVPGFREPVQFIFGRLHPSPTLVRIQDNSAENNNNSWIGDSNAFNHYQETFHKPGSVQRASKVDTQISLLRLPDGRHKSDGPLYSKMFNSMKNVIDSGRFETVGGILTPVFTDSAELRFGNYLALYRNPIKISELSPNGVISFGDATMGTFSINFADLPGSGFAIHIAQGNLAVLFESRGEKILEPRTISDITENAIDEQLKAQFGVGLCALTTAKSPENS